MMLLPRIPVPQTRDAVMSEWWQHQEGQQEDPGGKPAIFVVRGVVQRLQARSEHRVWAGAEHRTDAGGTGRDALPEAQCGTLLQRWKRCQVKIYRK